VNGWGAALNEAPSGTPRLNAIWGSAADDIFAVGEEGTILHFDGVGWTRMEHMNARASLLHVSGHDRDVYAVGGAGEIWRLAR
jgi:hypothetical protein